MSQDVRQLPIVTVIMPLHNHVQYVKEALCSVVVQDYPQKVAIIIDDGSTDNSYQWIKDCLSDTKEENDGFISGIATADKSQMRVFLGQNKQSQGPSATRNRAIKFGWDHTHLFSMLDCDDYYLPEKISRSVAEFLKDPEHIGIVYTDSLNSSINVKCLSL